MNTIENVNRVVSLQRVTLPLHKVDCASDAQTVEQILKQVPGVTTVYANPVSEKVYIEYDGTYTNLTQLRTTLEAAGYGPQGLHVTCGHCRNPSSNTSTAIVSQSKSPRWWLRWW